MFVESILWTGLVCQCLANTSLNFPHPKFIHEHEETLQSDYYMGHWFHSRSFIIVDTEQFPSKGPEISEVY